MPVRNPANFGKELVVDLHHVAAVKMSPGTLREFFTSLCTAIDMEAVQSHFWSDESIYPDEPHLTGTSAVQFIKTSNITVHCSPLLEAVHINVFSCKDFEKGAAMEVIRAYFPGRVVQAVEIPRY